MDKLGNSLTWRLAAIFALVMVGVAALVGILLILSNPVFAIIFALTCLGVGVVGWHWLFGRRRGAAWLHIGAELVLFAALANEIAFFLKDRRNVWLLVILLALGALGLGMGGLLRRRYVSEGGYFLLPTGAKPFLIVNPKSGHGRAMAAHIPDLARAKGIQVLMLEQGGSLTGLVEQAVEGGATILGMSGGDGSLGVAAGAAIKHDLPLVVLPGGTRCHFARDIGLDPEYIAGALQAFGGREVRIDAAEINGRIFLNNASFGLYADIVQRPGYRERKVKSSLDVLAEEATRAGYALEFHDASGVARHRAVMVLVGVNRYETLNLLELGTRNRLDEGVLQVTALYRLEQSLIRELGGFTNIRESSSRRPDDMAQWVAPAFDIAGETDTVAAGVDGEVVEFKSPVQFKILPSQLRLMVPPDSIQQRRTARTAVSRLQKFAVSGKLPHE